jgi:predicted alpha/beta superfamily hydrolase
MLRALVGTCDQTDFNMSQNNIMKTNTKKHISSFIVTGITALFVFLFSSSFAQSYPEVTIPGSQTRKFTSSIVSGQEYVLQISLPAGYANSNKKYPVVYVMDSQWDFPMITALYGQQYYDGFIPEMIIVGITWGGDRPNPDSLRARDYTPTNEQRLPQSGGAEKFLSVIKNEIFPLVENNYRIDTNDKTLIGCSLGGLFSMYTLFTHPEMFNRYIAASPAFTWDNSVLYQYEEKYFAGNSNPPAKLFMCVGGVEASVPGFEKLTSFLSDRHYTNLQMESRVLENTGHSGTKGEGYARGLQFVFKRPSLQLSSNILDKYKGSYKLNDGTIVNVALENGTLTATAGSAKFTLQAASETEFYITASFLKVHFVKDDKGNVSGFQLDRYGSSEFATRIN